MVLRSYRFSWSRLRDSNLQMQRQTDDKVLGSSSKFLKCTSTELLLIRFLFNCYGVSHEVMHGYRLHKNFFYNTFTKSVGRLRKQGNWNYNTHQISLKNWIETEYFSYHGFSTNLSNFTPCVFLFSFLSVEIRVYLPLAIHESTLGRT